MSKILMLTKVLFKSTFMEMVNSRKKNNSKSNVLGYMILLAIIFCGIGLPVVYFMNSILDILPIENIVISFVLPVAGVTSVMFAIFSVASVFYLSKDSDYLLPLPLEARDIMISKFFVSLINEYYILFICVFPFLIGVGVGIDAGVMYYLYSILIFILIPVIPSAIVTLIILFVTRFTNIFKKKDLCMYISLGLTLVFALVYNFFVQEFMNFDAENIGGLLGNIEENILPYLDAIFPFYKSANKALINYNNLNGVFSVISFIAFNVFAVVLLYWFGDKLYLKTVTVDRGSSSKKESIDKVVSYKEKRESSFVWLLKKEWLIIKRTPVFMLNIIIVVFMVPIIFICSFLVTFITQGIDVSSFSSSNVDISVFLNDPMIYCIVLSAMIFMSSVSLAAATAISREGNNAWFMKVIPVSYFKQINVKVVFASLVDIIGVLFIGIIPIIMYKINILYVVSVFVPLCLIIFILNYINIWIDLRKPKINWTDENAAVKQNMNGLVAMGICTALCAAFGLVAYGLYRFNVSINIYLFASILSLILAIILIAIIAIYKKNNDKLLNMVE